MPIASSLLNKPRLVEKLRLFYDYVKKNDGNSRGQQRYPCNKLWNDQYNQYIINIK